ncbi:MAG: nucleotide-binding protein, partial [Candidatus Brocadiales bacterium]
MDKLPRVMIAGTHSGVGKTTVTLGLMSALTQRGYKIQGFKVGPDFIDPGHHTAVTGNPSRNLDTWMMGVEACI